MTLAAEVFSPIASDWFSPTLEYVGRCTAEFSAPRGSVEGPATVSVDESGNVSVEMFPEPASLRTECPFRFGLLSYFGGNDFVKEHSAGVSTLDPLAENPCTELKVSTPHGTFRTDDILYRFTEGVITTGEVQKVIFTVGLSMFDAEDARSPAYWVLPLTNFLSECRQSLPDALDRHPLRIFPTPEVPDEITHVPFGPDHDTLLEKAWQCLMVANSKNRLIIFEFGEGLGFVERLPDYAESERLLLEGQERHKTTAVMVGPTGGQTVEDFEVMRNWFPFDILSLLTLATGTEVGCPWVEVRDGEGRLIRRFHRYLGIRPFRKGYHLIEEFPLRDRGIKATGRLIERACSDSKEFGETFVRAAIVHLVRARYADQTLDDSISHLARGFETLCKRYHTNEQVLSQNLSPSLRKNVTDILDDAAQRIRNLRAAAAFGERASLDQIANRAKSGDQKDKAFGLAVAKLLKAFWLPDAQILETHYWGRTDGSSALLSHYRGDVTHHGYLDILEAEHDWEEIAAIRNHLHDALARVILKILRFDGGYSPGVITYRGTFTVNWVRPHFPSKALGYK
jgi:hypothetical protein